MMTICKKKSTLLRKIPSRQLEFQLVNTQFLELKVTFLLFLLTFTVTGLLNYNLKLAHKLTRPQ